MMQMIERTGRDAEQVIQELVKLAEARQEPLRVRLPLTALNFGSGDYASIPDARWLMTLPADVEALKALIRGLELYFGLMVKLGGAAEMEAYLKECQAAIEGGDSARD